MSKGTETLLNILRLSQGDWDLESLSPSTITFFPPLCGYNTIMAWLCFNDLQEFTEIELVKQSDFNNIAFCFIY